MKQTASVIVVIEFPYLLIFKAMKKYLLILVCLLTLQGTSFVMSRDMKGDLNTSEEFRSTALEETDKPVFISVTVDAITPIPGSNSYQEPYIVHLHFENIYKGGRVWVVLELKNNVGTTSYTVEIPNQMKPDSIEEVTMESSISQVEVRDMQGRLLLQTENYEAVNHLSIGMYIVTITYSDGKVVTRKICP